MQNIPTDLTEIARRIAGEWDALDEAAAREDDDGMGAACHRRGVLLVAMAKMPARSNADLRAKAVTLMREFREYSPNLQELSDGAGGELVWSLLNDLTQPEEGASRHLRAVRTQLAVVLFERNVSGPNVRVREPGKS